MASSEAYALVQNATEFFTIKHPKTVQTIGDTSHLRFIIIDDEKPARDILARELAMHDEVEVLTTCATMDEAFLEITNLKPDAIFLDIELKRGNAFRLIERLKKSCSTLPAIIIITGHAQFEYGIKSIEHRDCIIKILQKPFWEEFEDTFEEIKDLIFVHQQGEDGALRDTQSMFVKFNNVTTRMQYNDVLYLEVAGSGNTLASMKDGEVIPIPKTLNNVLAELPENFVRISRYNAINIMRIKNIDHSESMIYLEHEEKGIGYSKSFYPQLAERLGLK